MQVLKYLESVLGKKKSFILIQSQSAIYMMNDHELYYIFHLSLDLIFHVCFLLTKIVQTLLIYL